MGNITNEAVSDQIDRIRTFKIQCLRKDKMDAIAQIVITIQQLLEEKFVGSINITINCSQGGISNVYAKTKETQKVG